MPTPPAPPPRPAAPKLTVPELVARLDALLTEHGPGRIELTGTVSSWRLNRGWASGELVAHHDGTVTSRIPFAIARRALPADVIGNDTVVALTGTLATQPPWQLIRLQGEHLRIIERSSVAARARTQLLETMGHDGRLAAQKRLQLPDVAVTIGLVTAAGSAARADITGTFTATRVPVRLIEEHVTLTGPTAPAAVADAITRLAVARPDVIIVARGGGATAELAAFDTEPVANAIAASAVPVITAIGHATDTTVADHVAHTHVVTPTAAAGLITGGHQRQRQREADLVTRRQLDTARAQAELARQATERAARQRQLALAALGIAVVLVFVLAGLRALG